MIDYAEYSIELLELELQAIEEERRALMNRARIIAKALDFKRLQIKAAELGITLQPSGIESAEIFGVIGTG